MNGSSVNRKNGQAGQGLVEYALLAVLILMVVGSLQLYGISLQGAYCEVVSFFGAEPAACGAVVLLEEAFDSLDAWTFTHGNGWVLEDGKLRIEEYGEHRAFTGDEEWEDYTIHLGETVLYEGLGYGVYFRVTDEPDINGYAFQYDEGYGESFIIREVVNGYELHPPIAVEPAPAGFDWYNTPHSVDVEVRGDTYTAYVDGNPVVSVIDDTSPSGKIGLRGWNTDALFDDLTVTQP